LKNKRVLIFSIISIMLIVIDQIIKLWSFNSLRMGNSITIISNILELDYLENRGAAFGIFQGNVVALAIISIMIMVIIIVYMVKNKIKNQIFLLALIFIISGGIGNLIDRIFRGFVIDYIELLFIKFPVFNMADVYVFLGAILISYYILFLEEKEKNNVI